MKASEAREIVNQRNSMQWPLCEIYELIASSAKAGVYHIQYSLRGLHKCSIDSLKDSLNENGYKLDHREGFNADGDFWEVLDINW